MTAFPLAKRLGQFCRLARLTPFETETEQGRSDERHRRIMLSSIASAVARAISILTALISVPLTLNYLGTERYGMWLTISSFIAILSFADLGMSNGLLNQVAAAHGQSNRPEMRRAVSSAFVMLSAIAMFIMVTFWIIYPFVSWGDFFNVSTEMARAEAGPAVAVFAVCFALTIPAAIVQKVQIGLQDSFRASLWQCAGSGLALGGIILVTQVGLGLPWLVLAFVGGPLAAAALNSFSFFLKSQTDISPRIASFSASIALHTANSGAIFLLLQVVAAASYSSDSLVIAHVLGPESVPQYAVPERLFGLVAMVVGVGLAPLWPAYGEAISRTDHDWVRTTLIRSIAMAVGVAAIGSILMAFAAPTLLRLWVGSAIQASPLLLIGLAVWKVLESGGNAVAMFMNGANVIQFQLFVATITGTVILTLKFFLVDKIGVSGAVWATVIGYTLFAAIPLTFRVLRLLNTKSGSH